MTVKLTGQIHEHFPVLDWVIVNLEYLLDLSQVFIALDD